MTNILQKIAEDLLEHKEHRIDINNEIDLTTFSSNISLFKYQQESLKNVIAILDLYFKDKITLKNYYLHKGFDETKYKKEKLELDRLLNRASFWMATGSGKSIVMIKLIEILYQMVSKKYIDKNDILILAPTDKILNQIKNHIDEFNKYSNFRLELNSLKDYEKMKNEKTLFTTDSIDIFYYRSDLIDNESNISKKTDGKRLNYENYINNGKWYIILDEAHKGKDELSAKKNYYNEMAKNGFIFNFSATFVDNIDKLTTVYNFNLAKFNEAGYGKNIKVVDEEFKGFNKKTTELSNDDKKDIILKSCILFSAQKKSYHKLQQIDKKLYHNPLMITVANTVNIKNADLKLYFLSLLEIAKEEPENFEFLKEELSKKLDTNKKYIFGEEQINDSFINSIESLTYQDILKYVFNSDKQGIIECKKTNLKDELLFKIKTSSNSSYFAMLKISDVKSWSNGILYGYDISEDVDTVSYFDNINKEESTINILMGSKIFSEGWDSNRPNIINFLNIGSANAKKYVMQTVGRGVRVEPLPDNRKRIQSMSLDDIKEFGENQDLVLENSNPLETLFIFATSKKDVDSIFKELPDAEEQYEKLNGIHKNKKINMPLYIPKYKQFREKQDVKYNFPELDYKRANSFVKNSSMNILLMNMIDKNRSNNLAKYTIDKLLEEDYKKYFVLNGFDDSKIDELDLINKIDKFFNAKLQDVDSFVEVSNEIQHYSNIKVNIKKVSIEEKKDIEDDIQNKKTNLEDKKQLLKQQYDEGKITIDELMEETQKIGSSSINKSKKLVDIRHLKEHFYTPILMKDKNEENYFKNIISEPSEIEFINKLEEYLEDKDNHLNNYDNWYFSKLQENTDKIFIPYIDYDKSKVSNFYPDFIFWLKKGDNYIIKFVDPKGLEQGTYNLKDKLEGFEKIFNNKNLSNDKYNFNVELYLYNKSRKNNEFIDKYVEFNLDEIF